MKHYITVTAEALALLLTVLLPVKFASIVSVPEMPASYWFDTVSLLFTSYPITLFSFASGILFLLALCLKQKEIRNPAAAVWCAAGLLLALLACAGWIHASCKEYPLQMTSYALGVFCYGGGLFLLLEHRPEFGKLLFRAVFAGLTLSALSGFYQYFVGFEALRQHVAEQNMTGNENLQTGGMFLQRIQESRLQADFSVCNTYGGYLAVLLSLVSVSAWIFGNKKVQPEKLARWLLSLIAAGILLFLLVQTGSRGALLALCAGFAMLFLTLPLNRKIRIAFGCFVILAFGAFIGITAAGRGFKSMIFRFDYDWAAFRMMLRNPLFGTGWGDFFHDFQVLKLLTDQEAPHTPHNMPLLFGSQCGISAFLTACFVLFYPLCHAVRSAWKRKKETPLMHYAFVFAFAAAITDFMLELCYETPAFYGLFTAIVLLYFYQYGGEEAKPLPKGTPVLRAGLVLFAAGSLCLTAYYMRSESAFAEFQENVDLRFSREAIMTKNYTPPPPAKVMRLFKDAAVKGPQNPFLRATMADYMASRGELYQAEQLITEAIRLSPLRSSFYLRRAKFRYHMTGDITQAKDDLDTVRKLFPMNDKYQVSDLDLLQFQQP